MPTAHPEASPDKSAVASRAMLRAADLLGLSARELAGIVGVSEATLSRLKHDPHSARLPGKAYELALLFIRLFRSLDAITGGDERSSKAWMRAGNSVLGDTPLRRIRTIEGLTHVLAYLDARRAPL